MKIFGILVLNILTFINLDNTYSNCYFYDDQYNCGSSVTEDTWDQRCFQTPTKGGTADPVYHNTYQGMHYIVGYLRQKYSEDRTSCQLTIFTRVNLYAVSGKNYEYVYSFENVENNANLYNYYFDSHQQEVTYTARKSDNLYEKGIKAFVIIREKSNKAEVARVDFEEVYFLWNVPEMKYEKEFNEKGQKGVIVELFGWPYEDIIEESDFIKLSGYLGIKITPPNEHIMNQNWIESNGLNPWEYFTQPVSYKIKSRFGDKKALKNMIYTVREKGIRIYSQVVINHMTHQGNDIYNNHYNWIENSQNCVINHNWPGKNASAGSPFFTAYGRMSWEKNPYTLNEGRQDYQRDPIFEYPAVPYCGTDFHCRGEYTEVSNLGKTWIRKSLHDLNTGKDYVRQRIADFLTDLMSLGVSGFSVYQGKYISTVDYIEIFKKLRDNFSSSKFPDDFITIIEISTTNDEIDELICQDSNDGNFGGKFESKLKEAFVDNEYKKIKIEVGDFPDISPNCFDKFEAERYVMSFEGPDNQNNDTDNIQYKITTIEEHYTKYTNMFESDIQNKIRKVFSSYSLGPDPDVNDHYIRGNGFPDGKSDCTNMGSCIEQGVSLGECVCKKNVPYVKAFVQYSDGYDTGDRDHWIYGNYTRIHRRKEIVNAMRNWMGLNPLSTKELNTLKSLGVEEGFAILPTTIITTFPKTTLLTTFPKTTLLTTIPKTTILTTMAKTTILTTLAKTTILTTIPKTTILTTIPKTTVLTTIPKTTILTTIPKTTILTTIPKTTLLTTIPKTTILTTIPKTTILTTFPKTTILTTFPKTTILTTIPKTTYLTTFPKTTYLTTIPKTTFLTTIPKTTFLTTIPKTTFLTTIPKTTLLTTIPKITQVSTIPKGSILSTIPSLSLSCPEKCENCNDESIQLDLCVTCNTNDGYYRVNYNNHQIYIECLKNDSSLSNSKILSKFYFDPVLQEFNLCYETCKTCTSAGDPINHNCITCDEEHLFIPGKTEHNCITECKYYYYFTYLSQYKCTIYPQCPEEAKLFIKSKKKCLDDCLKDNDFKYQYNGECLRECPEGTINDNFICKIQDENSCTLNQKNLDNLNLENEDIMENLVKNYLLEFGNTNNVILDYQNNNYNMMLFKKSSECISELSLKISEVEFGECYNKIKNEYNLEDDLLIAILENYKKLYNNQPTITFYLFNPITGENLDFLSICQEDTLTVNQNLEYLLNNTDEFKVEMDLINQNINIFDPTDDFYSDLCFHFISPIKKDIPLKDRLSEFYPNITLCDSGCKNIGINLTSKAAICQCKMKNLMNLENNEVLGDTVSEFSKYIDNSNIEVIKCIIPGLKYLHENYGGIIIISFGSLTTSLTFLFFIFKYASIKIYLFKLTNNYLSFLDTQPINAPPKLKKEKVNEKITVQEIEYKKKKKIGKNEEKATQKSIKSKKTNISAKYNNLITNSKNLKSEVDLISYKYDLKNKKSKSKFNKKLIQEKNENRDEIKNPGEFFSIYLAKPVEEMDFNDAYKYDKRGFSEIFCDLLYDKVITINTFCKMEPLRPMILKMIIYILNLTLYFIINGLFFSENYISEVYHLEEEETFFSFVPRSINRFIYTFFVGVLVQFLINCFFIEERRIKRIFIREKDNPNEIRSDMVKTIKIIQSRLIKFFIIVFIIFIISFLYVISFNYVYHFTQFEWIKSSIFIFVMFELLFIILCLIITIIRLISLHCKSERLFNLSNMINNI